ncbi:uncharacterized protein TNCT_528201 [Trichonephila clavata]|uniref:EGF-like domain-containing protein n=1 Tax=Trichonephila clavata TaxID=2740835 RepID=A0A8X6JHW9_TRICU|nr:uncharacterized protein TNCT_528201 [Trichonephila clavata]
MTRRIFVHTCALVFLFAIPQSIHTSGALADNLEEASSEISVLESLIDENHRIHDLEESVLKSNEQCNQNTDCYHAGKCVTKEDGIKECECKNGTSGPLCKVVDECVDKSNKCGSGKDVQCVFDIVSEKAVCKCNNSSKKFDTITKTCRVPCELYSSDCGDYGTCRRDYVSKNTFAFCSCRKGVRGDRCETIDKCVNKEVDCGEDPTVICALNYNDVAYCKCNKSKQAFDDSEKVCKDCDCGQGSTQCSFVNGKKTCDCKGLYFFNGEKCEDCKCGQGSKSCSMVDGKKICDCIEYFEHRLDQCALCDCWKNGENCTFNNAGEKQCDCYPGYTMSKTGSCVAFCNSTHKCQNGGTCNKVCQCPKGTSGDFCEKVDWCDYDKCGFYFDEVECLYNETSGEGYCNCKRDKHYYEEVTKRCYECNCGDYGECILAYNAKVCICQEGYADYLLKCKRCDCGYASVNCSFKALEGKLCQCKEGYAQKTRVWNYDEVDATCAPCDCGKHGKCRYDNEEMVCECDENYKAIQGKCKECFCGYDGYCDFNSNGEKTCLCDKGFIPHNGICTPCNCDNSSLGDMQFSCHFVDGVKQCDCPDGFEATADFCEDINECLNTSSCPFNTICKNLPGTYMCECKPGFRVLNESLDPKDVGCEDINECEHNGTCISDTCVCINNPGSYDCVCKDGYYMAAASSGEHYNPTYNQCYAKDYSKRKTSIIIGVILAVAIVSVTGYIMYKKHWSSSNSNSGLEMR